MDVPRFINLLSQTDGRDKIYKTLQNVVKILAATSTDKSTTKKLNVLSKSMGEGRSIMRMGKWVGNINKLKAFGAKASKGLSTQQLVEIARVIGDFGYVLGDNLSYLAKYDVIPLHAKNTAKNSKIFQFWGFVCAVILEFWNLFNLRVQLVKGTIDTKQFAKSSKAGYLSLIKNLSDLLVTLNAVGYCASFYKPSAVFLGAAGATSGAIGTYTNWNKTK